MSWNPVWGCNNTCIYCYARKIAKRYAKQIAEKQMIYRYGENWVDYKLLDQIKTGLKKLVCDLQTFKPTWLESNYVRKFPKKPSIIFVNSMSDPAYWKQEWYEKILKRITENFQHTFVILTKKPRVYREYFFPHNTILGVSINNYQDCIERLSDEMLDLYKNLNNKLLISIEPIQNTFRYAYIEALGEVFDWIHVGAESGNRKGKILATPEMIKPFYDIRGIQIFMKNNLAGICPGELRKEFPV